MQNNKLLYKAFIFGFLVLYIGIALISFFHSIQFFSIGNSTWMAVVVGACFELGNFLSLAAILLTDKNKKATMPWILLIIMVSIQCIANTYSTYKFIALSGTDYYQYLAKPLLFWIQEVSQETVQIIISWIIGAILPIVALFMTDMVAANIKNMHEVERESSETDKIEDKQADQIVSAPVKKREQSDNKILAGLNNLNDSREKEQSDNKQEVKEEIPVVEQVNENTDSKKKFLTKLKNLWNQ